MPGLGVGPSLGLAESCLEELDPLDNVLLIPGICDRLRLLQQFAERAGGIWKKVAKDKLRVPSKFDVGPEAITHLFGKMFEIVTQKSGGGTDIILREMIFKFGPDVAVIPLGRTEVDGPSPEMDEVATLDEALRLMCRSQISSCVVKMNWVLGKLSLRTVHTWRRWPASTDINTSSSTASVKPAPKR